MSPLYNHHATMRLWGYFFSIMSKCEYCLSKQKMEFERWDCIKERSAVFIEDGEIVICLRQGYWHEEIDSAVDIKINFCPMCGRDLRKEDSDGEV